MGLNSAHGLGRERKFFAKTETSSGTFLKPTATDAAKMLASSIDLQQERADRLDSRQSRAVLERITGRANVPWSCEGYLIPSGTAGTPPDIHALLIAAMGGDAASVYTNVPATSDTYVLVNSQAPDTLSVVHHLPGVYMESCWGAWVESMTITAASGEPPKIAFEGGAMGYAWTGTSLATNSDTGTSVEHTASQARNFSVNSVVSVGDDTDLQVSAVDYVTPAITIPSTTFVSGEAILPYTPTETVAGSPISGVVGSFKIDTVSIPITAYTLTLTNNIKPMDDEVVTRYPSDIIPGYRSVTGSISFRARKDLIKYLGHRNDYQQDQLELIMGTTAGSICTVEADQVEYDFNAVEVPEAEEAVITLPFVALGTSTNEDEFDIVFT
jgi:hypothetical protein